MVMASGVSFKNRSDQVMLLPWRRLLRIPSRMTVSSSGCFTISSTSCVRVEKRTGVGLLWIFAESAWTLPAPRDAARPTGGIFSLTSDEIYSFLVVQSGWESWLSHPGPCFLTRVWSFQWNRSSACANWDWPPSRGATALSRHVNAFHLLFKF